MVTVRVSTNATYFIHRILKDHRMKNTLAILFALGSACAFAQPSDPAPKTVQCLDLDFEFDWGLPKTIFNKGNQVKLPGGSILLLKAAENWQPDQVTVGRVFRFRVVADVMAEGEIAIRTGAYAMGRAKSIEPSSYNDPATIRVEMMYAQAVDGQLVPLMGDELALAAPQTTSIMAHVTNTMTVKVD